MLSGAGHDACQLAAVMPTAMIFIPCDKGISHAEDEDITQVWSTNGAQALLQAVLRIDSQFGSQQ
jgi:N-carbamoyl-L-amino-acid hydrolase